MATEPQVFSCAGVDFEALKAALGAEDDGISLGELSGVFEAAGNAGNESEPVSFDPITLLSLEVL